jgi:predicted RNA-binding protein with PIN domain
VPPPPALRPYLSFAKQTPRSLEAIARVVERDDEFRGKVAEVVAEAEVGRAGWLWLTRPEGWRAELAGLEAASAAREAVEVEEREERAATRKLAAAQAAAVRAETEAAARLAELDEIRTELAGERTAHARALARVAELEALLEDLTAARAEVVRNLKVVESRLVDRATEVKAVKARVRALEAEARDLRTEAGAQPRSDPATSPAEADTAAPDDARAPAATDAPTIGSAVAAEPGGPVTARHLGGRPDPADVASEVARAAGGATALADALAALARLLDDATPTADTLDPAMRPAADRGVATPPFEGAGATTRPRERRVPVSLPGGMFDDSVEAAEHLLRTPGSVLVVDGYNVTMEGWPELGAADQRRRLVVGLSDLAARTATTVELVFDGAEVEPLSVPTPTRQLVRVRFSDPGVEADDVVIDLVGRIAAATPVIVVSSDNRVRDGARRGGANLLHARQLVAILRR